jgi:serine/threonine-protein kinase
MALSSGSSLGPYEILSPIGAGGMGEVYKARDTRLNRDVAIKVLLHEVSNRPDLQARFEREAQTIASLNHPHICTIHDVGRHDNTHYLVMEYLEGETLADRIGRGALPLDQVLKYAIEIADALDKAHRRGVTHRDLKPSNIMLTKSGTKLLDFGLAKLRQEAQPANALSALPTNAAITADGAILGTVQYMAPEQLEGEEADARTDIFAFGTVVYEMATGKKTFEGKSQAGLIAAILDREPPAISSLQPAAPAQLDHLVKRCLAKEPDDRWQSATDLGYELKWIAGNPSQSVSGVSSTPIHTPQKRRFFAIPAWIAVVAVVLTAVAVWIFKPAGSPHDQGVVRLEVSLPPGEKVEFSGGPPIAISPDGAQMVYGTRETLYLRAIDNLDPKPISGTAGATNPFFSPDGQWIGFFAQGKLKKIALTGGPAQVVCDASYGVGGSWGSDGTIYFAPSNISGLFKVPAAGGMPQEVTKLDRAKGEITHRWPQILPGNQALLFTVWTGPGSDEKTVELLILATNERRVVSRGANTGRYIAPGYIVDSQAGSLFALPFNVSRLEVPSGAAPAPLDIQVNELGEGAAFAVSDEGMLAYLSGNKQFERKLVWVDRKGNVEPLASPARGYENLNISADGKFAVVQTQGPNLTIWIYDFARTTLTPFTTNGSSQAAVWAPDGKHIAYRGTRNGFRNVYWKATDGNSEEEALTSDGSINTPGSLSPDGKWLTFAENNPATGNFIWALPLDGERKRQLFQKNATNPRFSPDGHWIAYRSQESGRSEIYVRPFQTGGGKIQISTDGGDEPLWSRDGRELFYINGDKMMAVDIRTQPTFTAGTPQLLFTGRYQSSPNGATAYDVSPDGKRFLKIQPASSEQATTQINVVINWPEELKRRVPTK